MKLQIVTGKSTDEGTFGKLSFPEESDKTFVTIELPWRNNEKGKSCIPAGTYKAVWHKSPSKGMCYILLGTEPRDHVLIHAGNFAGNTDEGFTADFLGCIGLGKSKQTLMNKEEPGKMQMAITSSKLAIQEFHEITKEADLEITIIREAE